MANSGTINGSWSGTNYMTLRVDWALQSQDSVNLTSTVQLQWIATRTTTSQTTYKQSAAWTQTVAGTSSSGTKTFDIRSTAANADYVYRTDTVVIAHNADGTASPSISGTINLSGTSAKTGTVSGSFNLPAIATTPPTVSSFSASDVGGIVPSAWGIYVQNKSTIRLTCVASGEDGATIASYSWYKGSALLATTTASTYDLLATDTGTVSFHCIVTDSRGNTTVSNYIAFPVYAYSNPVINSTTTFRCDSGGTADDSGAYASVCITYTYASAHSHNSITAIATLSGANTNLSYGNAQVIGGSLATTTLYKVTYTVTDSLGGTATKTDTIPYLALPPFSFYPSADAGAAFGEVAQDNKFLVNHPATFRYGVTAEGAVQSTKEQGSSIKASHGKASTAASVTAQRTDTNVAVSLEVGAGGANHGVYSETFAKWIVHADSNGDVHLNGNAATATADSGGNALSVATVTSGVVSGLSSGTLLSQSASKYGKLCQMTIQWYGTIAAGGTVTASVASGYRPPAGQNAIGAGYYGQRAFVGYIDDSGALSVRNTSGSSASPTSGTPLIMTFMYLLA